MLHVSTKALRAATGACTPSAPCFCTYSDFFVRRSTSSLSLRYNTRVPETKPNRNETLTRVPIFSGLSEAELAFLSQRIVSRRFSAGETVFAEGESCTGLYVVRVRPCLNQEFRWRKRTRAQHRRPRRISGRASGIRWGNYPASATALDDATLLFVSRQDFQSLCLEHRQVSLKVLRIVGARLRRLVGIIEELSFTTVRHRLAAFPLRSARTSGEGVTGLQPEQENLPKRIGRPRKVKTADFASMITSIAYGNPRQVIDPNKSWTVVTVFGWNDTRVSSD